MNVAGEVDHSVPGMEFICPDGFNLSRGITAWRFQYLEVRHFRDAGNLPVHCPCRTVIVRGRVCATAIDMRDDAKAKIGIFI